jgi:hypothetical protein
MDVPHPCRQRGEALRPESEGMGWQPGPVRHIDLPALELVVERKYRPRNRI